MMLQTKVCKTCGAQFGSDLSECPDDGGSLDVMLVKVDPLIGSTLIGKYEILSLLGRGAMSRVYKARQVETDKVVAIKILKEHLVDDQTAVGRFKREAQAVSLLQHPNIISVLDFGITPSGTAFLVMDFLDGQTLDEVIADNGHLNALRAVPLFCQIASALAEAYENKVIHRDLKPSNVCVLQELNGAESVKIFDFGLAKFIESEGDSGRHLTKPGQVCGSPLYMSPEQVQGKSLDCRSDIYSFGCVMYEVLSGDPPFIASSTFETMSRRMAEDVPPFAVQLQVPPQLEAVVMRALKKNPDERYQTAAELQMDLEPLVTAFSCIAGATRVGDNQVNDSQSNVVESNVSETNVSEANDTEANVTDANGAEVNVVQKSAAPQSAAPQSAAPQSAAPQSAAPQSAAPASASPASVTSTQANQANISQANASQGLEKIPLRRWLIAILLCILALLALYFVNNLSDNWGHP